MVAEDAVHELALRGLKCSVRIDEVLDANQGPYVLPPAAAKEVEDMCFEFFRVNATLVLTFHRATPAVALSNCTMENHYLMHVGVATRYINPLVGSCYQGETLMQVAKKMVKASAGGSSLTHGEKCCNAQIWLRTGLRLGKL